MSIGKIIKEKRLELGYSVDDLAKKLGKNRATVYRYEKDEIENLPISVLKPLAEALNTTPGELLNWQNIQDVPMERKKADNNVDNNENIHLSSNEQKLVTNYRTLNEDGQERLLEYSEDMVLSGRYIKTDKNGLLEKEA